MASDGRRPGAGPRARPGPPGPLPRGDPAYSSAKEQDFQLPARALGYQVVYDYKIDQLGVKGSREGFLLIEGAFCCPSIPQPLIDAALDFGPGRIDEATYRAHLEERWHYPSPAPRPSPTPKVTSA